MCILPLQWWSSHRLLSESSATVPCLSGVPIITATIFSVPWWDMGNILLPVPGSYRWSPRLLPSLRLHWFCVWTYSHPVQWGPAKICLPRPAEVGHWVTSVLIPSFGKYHHEHPFQRRMIPEHSTLSQFWYEAVSYLKCYIQVCCPAFPFESGRLSSRKMPGASTVEMKQNCELKVILSRLIPSFAY